LPARTTVHLQLILDRLSPHDAVLSATIPEHINQSAVDGALDLAPEGAVTPAESAPLQIQHGQAKAAARKKEEDEAQSVNPEVMNILARLRAEKSQQTHTHHSDLRNGSTDSTRLSSSAASGRGIILDPYLAQLSPVRSPERPTFKSKPSSERGSMKSQGMLSLSNYDDLDMIDYAYGMLAPKVKHTAKPATDEKVQKTREASQVRQKLPAGMRIGASRNNSKTSKDGDIAKGVRGHGRSNSAIEEWRQKNATSEMLVLRQTEDALAQESLKQNEKKNDQSKVEIVRPSRENSKTSRTRSTKIDSKRAVSEQVDNQVETKAPSPSKSHEVLRPELPNGRQSYTSYDNRTMLTPEKQRLMKALAMRRQGLSRRTTQDSHFQVSLQTPLETAEHQEQPGILRAMEDTNGVGDREDESTLLADGTLDPMARGQEKPTTNFGSKDDGNVDEELSLPILPARSPLTIQSLEESTAPVTKNEHGQTMHQRGFENEPNDRPRHLSVDRLASDRRGLGSRRSSPRVLSRRTSEGLTPGSDGAYEGPSPSESLLEELRHATVHEARRVSTLPLSPPVAQDLMNSLPSPPLPLSSVASPTNTVNEVKSSPVDSILAGYPFPRALATVHEASSPLPSPDPSTVRLSRVDEGDGESSGQATPIVYERPRTRKGKELSQLSISQTTQDSEEFAFGTFLNLSPTASHVSTTMTLPEKTSHNPRGNSRLPDIHPNSRRPTEPSSISPKQPDKGRSNTLTLSSRFLETSPVKRTLSSFSRNRFSNNRGRPQSTNDLMMQDTSPIKPSYHSSGNNYDNPRASISSFQSHQLNNHNSNRDSVGNGADYSRRNSIQSSHLGGFGHRRRSSQISIAPSTDNESEKKSKRGSWAMRTIKRMSGLSTTSRASLTRLGEQCDQDPPNVAKMPPGVHAAAASVHEMRPKRPIQHQQQQGPMVIGELNVQLPDSLVCLLYYPTFSLFPSLHPTPCPPRSKS